MAIEDGLILHYTLDEGSGSTVTDSSPNGNDGTIINFNASMWVPGVWNDWALEFTPASIQYIEPPSNPPNQTSAISYSFWAKPNSAAQDVVTESQMFAHGYQGVQRWNHNSSTYRRAFTIQISGQKRLQLGINDVPVGSWTHIAHVYNGTNVICYINGSQVNSIGASGNISGSGDTFRIAAVGYAAPIAGNIFDGSIDDFRIYNRALTQPELDELSTEGGGLPTGETINVDWLDATAAFYAPTISVTPSIAVGLLTETPAYHDATIDFVEPVPPVIHPSVASTSTYQVGAPITVHNIPKPTGTSTGDLVIIHLVSADSTINFVAVIPTNTIELISRENSQGGCIHESYALIADDADGPNYTFISTSGAVVTAIATRIIDNRAIDPSLPLTAFDQIGIVETDNQTSFTLSSLAPSTDKCLALGIISARENGVPFASTSAFTLTEEVGLSGAVRTSSALFERDLPGFPAPSGDCTGTKATTGRWYGQQLLVLPKLPVGDVVINCLALNAQPDYHELSIGVQMTVATDQLSALATMHAPGGASPSQIDPDHLNSLTAYFQVFASAPVSFSVDFLLETVNYYDADIEALHQLAIDLLSAEPSFYDVTIDFVGDTFIDVSLLLALPQTYNATITFPGETIIDCGLLIATPSFWPVFSSSAHEVSIDRLIATAILYPPIMPVISPIIDMDQLIATEIDHPVNTSADHGINVAEQDSRPIFWNPDIATPGIDIAVEPADGFETLHDYFVDSDHEVAVSPLTAEPQFFDVIIDSPGLPTIIDCQLGDFTPTYHSAPIVNLHNVAPALLTATPILYDLAIANPMIELRPTLLDARPTYYDSFATVNAFVDCDRLSALATLPMCFISFGIETRGEENVMQIMAPVRTLQVLQSTRTIQIIK